mmetsp:Transcript_7919/g.17660  ORF Transcript_7919/g.17660 Transcript_7919/m.17660 type:complete len:214 (-) Transcript_7919:29-670(-)
MSLRQSISHSQLLTVPVLAKHGNVGSVKIVDWVQLNHVFNLRIPSLSLFYIHDEICKHETVAGSFHRSTPTEERWSQILEVVYFANVVYHVAFASFNVLPFQVCGSAIIYSTKSTTYTRSCSRDGQSSQWRNILNSTKQLFKVGKFNLHPVCFGRSRSLQSYSLLENRTCERRRSRHQQETEKTRTYPSLGVDDNVSRFHGHCCESGDGNRSL